MAFVQLEAESSPRPAMMGDVEISKPDVDEPAMLT